MVAKANRAGYKGHAKGANARPKAPGGVLSAQPRAKKSGIAVTGKNTSRPTSAAGMALKASKAKGTAAQKALRANTAFQKRRKQGL